MSKLTVGWFTFTCCEDSTIMMTEMLNEHWQEWTKLFDFKYAKILRRSQGIGPMDIAFVEGAISSPSQEKRLASIRQHAKVLVAIGSCAVTGQPSSQRNTFSPEQQAAIDQLLKKFDYADNVKKLDECVKVDHQVPGCPMNETMFLDLIKQLTTPHASN